MPATTPVNRLVEGLPGREHDRFLERCGPVDLVFGTILYETAQPISHVYFPVTGFISLMVSLAGHAPLEMGLIGSEGMLGETLVLGINTSPMRAVVQGPGSALRMSAPQFRHALRDSPALLRTVKRYLYVLKVQMSQTAACTHFHEVGPRLARWLLMTHDRAHADHFHLTHQYLADMLGVQRSAITIAAGVLQRRKLIRYTRGEISVLDRKGLEAASCGCYAGMAANYNRLFN